MKLASSLFVLILLFCSIGYAATPPTDAPKLTAKNHGVLVRAFQGNGNKTTESFPLKKAPARFAVQLNWDKPDPELTGEKGKFSVLLVDDSEKDVDLIIGTIDSFDGARTIDIPADGNYKVKIIAPGNWNVSIEQ